MNIFSGLRGIGGIMTNQPPKSPWGGKAGDGDGDGNGDSGKGDGGGPRNPWSFPPEGKRGRPAGPSALDELLKRAKRGGPGGGGGGGGFGGGLPGGIGGGRLWTIGIGILVAVWLVFTSFQSISPQERGVVTFFGKYSRILEPGIHVTLPAPINSVTKIDVQNIRTENFPESQGSENLMLTGDQNIVDLGYSVRWDIANPQDYAFQIARPQDTVRATAESAMREVVSSVLLDQALGAGRTVIEARVQERIQQILDDYNSGIRIQGVAISKADPPAAVNDDFKAVSASQQQAQTDLNQARAYAQQVIARAQGEAAQFDRIYEQYRQAPEVTRRRLYYETMEAVLAKSNKTVIEAPGVTPYLPLPELRRGQPQPQPQAEPAAPPAAQQGGAR
ncbi:protease modulator HflK [Sphingomonas sp.]|uniref:protease modulator HflK n=1 Tax=Sphingomonas sp. TaxID=28214 RepID=UPI002DD64653|nr:protease modulator HflK [Sphingomonas sp.]